MKRPSKYRNKPTIVDGIKFQSAKEARRYSELKLLEKYGQISELKRQVRYKLVQVVTYVADFEYFDVLKGEKVTEDVKGFKTEVYKRKKKLMKEQHSIEILES
jgi:hypothetical protein